METPMTPDKELEMAALEYIHGDCEVVGTYSAHYDTYIRGAIDERKRILDLLRGDEAQMVCKYMWNHECLSSPFDFADFIEKSLNEQNVDESRLYQTTRLAVPGGWIYNSLHQSGSMSSCFVPNPGEKVNSLKSLNRELIEALEEVLTCEEFVGDLIIGADGKPTKCTKNKVILACRKAKEQS